MQITSEKLAVIVDIGDGKCRQVVLIASQKQRILDLLNEMFNNEPITVMNAIDSIVMVDRP